MTPQKRTGSAGRRKPRFTKARPPAPKRPAARRGAVAMRQAALRAPAKSHADRGLPGWDELASAARNERRDAGRTGFFEGVSTVRFGVLLLLVAAAFTLYIGHVHASQELLANLRQAQHDNRALHLKYNRLKGDYDRRTGPAVIYRRARALGLEAGGIYGPTIEVN